MKLKVKVFSKVLLILLSYVSFEYAQAQSTSHVSNSRCSSPLWNEVVEPLLRVYLAAVDGFVEILGSIDEEYKYLSALSTSFPSLSNQEVITKYSEEKLCGFKLDEDTQMACLNNFCTCKSRWQSQIISVQRKNGGLNTTLCYAKLGSKCRQNESWLREFKGWIQCMPGSSCVATKKDLHRVVLRGIEMKPIYGFCKCQNKTTCDQIEQEGIEANPHLNKTKKSSGHNIQRTEFYKQCALLYLISFIITF